MRQPSKRFLAKDRLLKLISGEVRDKLFATFKREALHLEMGRIRG